MTPRGVGGWGTQCPLSLPHPARAPPVRLPQAQPQSTGSVRGRGWLWPWRRRQGLPEPRPLPPARPPGRRPGHRGNAEEEGGARGLTGDMSRLSPGSADPRPPLPLGPTRAPRPSLTPPVRRLLHLLLHLLPPLGRGSCSGSARRRRRRRRRPRERRRRRRLQNAHARSTQAPPPNRPAPPSRSRPGFGPAFPAAFRSPLKGAAQKRVVRAETPA